MDETQAADASPARRNVLTAPFPRRITAALLFLVGAGALVATLFVPWFETGLKVEAGTYIGARPPAKQLGAVTHGPTAVLAGSICLLAGTLVLLAVALASGRKPRAARWIPLACLASIGIIAVSRIILAQIGTFRVGPSYLGTFPDLVHGPPLASGLLFVAGLAAWRARSIVEDEIDLPRLGGRWDGRRAITVAAAASLVVAVTQVGLMNHHAAVLQDTAVESAILKAYASVNDLCREVCDVLGVAALDGDQLHYPSIDYQPGTEPSLARSSPAAVSIATDPAVPGEAVMRIGLAAASPSGRCLMMSSDMATSRWFAATDDTTECTGANALAAAVVEDGAEDGWSVPAGTSGRWPADSWGWVPF